VKQDIADHPNCSIHDDRGTLESGASRSLPSPARLLLVAVVLPTFAATTNQVIYDNLGSSFDLRPWLYPWMALTTALLSWCAGRYIYPAWLRWLLFGWCLLLLDVLTIAAGEGHRVDDGTSYMLVAAQVNFLTFWAIMGPLGWQFRLPIVLVGSGAMIGLCSIITNSWTSQGWAFTMMLTPVVGGALCIGLRLLGLRLQRISAIRSENAAYTKGPQQFGLRHMFVWATAVVPLLLVLRGLDLLFFVPWVDGESAFAATLLATGVATINLTAVWCILGTGWMGLRLAALVAIPTITAAGLTYYSYYLQSLYSTWANMPILDTFIEMQADWFTWCIVSAALLAALLLFLRASGFQLVGRAR
jgi:hypothetical protein